jgi:nucleotide-binding universal stress UspA family protein
MNAGRRDVFRSILCPVDFSDHSRAALQYAARIAADSGARLTALFVSDPLLVEAAAAAAYDKGALERTSEGELGEFISRTMARAGGPKDVACFVVPGNPAVEILKAARRMPADLIVIGTQGLSGAGKLFFGSTTERILRQATVPVLAIPPWPRRRSVPASWPGKRIVAALDLGPAAAGDARAAAHVARSFHTDLVLVHVVKPTQAPRWLSGSLRGHDRARIEKARARLEQIARQIEPDVASECQVLVGDPAEQIPAATTDAKTGLVILTLRRVNGLFGSEQGTTTYRVLTRAGTPVLALPKGWGKGHGNTRKG